MQIKVLVWLLVAGALLAFWLGVGQAQNNAVDQGCNNPVMSNAGADITIDATVGGVTVIAATNRGTRCAAVICNTGANPMVCDSVDDLVVDATHGLPIASGTCQPLGWESYHNWKCIRTTGSSTTARAIVVGLGPKN